MRVELKGIASAKKRLADGRVVKYHYAWRGGPRLDGQPGEPSFIASYNAAVALKKTKPSGTLRFLIDEFRNSPEFTALAPRTRIDYEGILSKIELRFGSMPLSAVEDKRARSEFKSWRDERAKQSLRQADYGWTVLARVLSIAKDRGRIEFNRCERGGRFYHADRTEKIWAQDDIERFNTVASAELRLAHLLALWTGQRQGDLLKLTWSAYDGTHIRLRQGKKRKRVSIPVGTPLKTALDATKRSAVTILTNTRGKPWSEGGFRSSWGKAYDKSGIESELTFHDLRGTAVTRLALAKCSVPQIAAFTGHSLKDVEAILDAHYLGGSVELAAGAGGNLNAVYGTGT